MLLNGRGDGPAAAEEPVTGPGVTVVGGKGGVGKSSVATAIALATADAGARTLLLSTDPAHSLGDVLDTRLGDEPREVTPGLWAVEPDADRTVARRLREVERDAAQVLPREIMPAVRRHLALALDGPGTREAALADRLVEALGELGPRWDRVVVDSAPTGHLLQLVRAPSAMADWVAGLAARRERSVAATPADPYAHAVGRGAEDGPSRPDGRGGDDPLLVRLRARQTRTAAAARVLRDDAEVRLVCTPRRVVVAETERAADALRDAGLTLGRLVLNHPGGTPDAGAQARVRSRFPDLVVTPTAASEPVGPAALRRWWAERR